MRSVAAYSRSHQLALSSGATARQWSRMCRSQVAARSVLWLAVWGEHYWGLLLLRYSYCSFYDVFIRRIANTYTAEKHCDLGRWIGDDKETGISYHLFCSDRGKLWRILVRYGIKVRASRMRSQCDNHSTSCSCTVYMQQNAVACRLKARFLKTADTAVARRWFSSRHAIAATDTHATME
jgi:hypothetical protein